MKPFVPCLVGACIALSLSACRTPPDAPKEVAAGKPPSTAPAIAPPRPVETPKPANVTAQKEQALNDALTLYADGRYDDALMGLAPLAGAPELPLSSQVKALKFMAFSHCVSNRLRLCRQHFDLALERDPAFQLTEAEKGHPVWGREFNSARFAARNKPPLKKAP